MWIMLIMQMTNIFNWFVWVAKDCDEYVCNADKKSKCRLRKVDGD